MPPTATRPASRHPGHLLPRAAWLLWMVTALVLGACASFATEPDPSADAEEGVASYYSDRRDGRRTASGEPYDPDEMTAAHRRLAFGTRVRVRDLDSGREVVVRINDRGPFVRGRIIDLSYRAAKKLDMLERGVIRVRVTPLK